MSPKEGHLRQLVKGPYTYDAMGICTTGKKPIYIYSRGRFEDGNNIWMTSDNFQTQVQVTDVNPQQRDYNWGTVELVSWNTEDGIRAEGLLFKPENFDPAKKYPLMIYFYENIRMICMPLVHLHRVVRPSTFPTSSAMSISCLFPIFIIQTDIRSERHEVDHARL